MGVAREEPGSDGGARSLRRRLRALEALTSGAGLAEVLADLALSVEDALPGALCAILICDPDDAALHAAAAPSLPARLAQALAAISLRDESAWACALAVREVRPVVWADVDEAPLESAVRALLRDATIRAVWSVPIPGPDGPACGALTVYRTRPGRPSESDTAVLEEAVRLCGVAVRRHRRDAAMQDRLDLLATGQRLTRQGSFAFDLQTRRWWLSETWVDHVGAEAQDLSDAAVRALIHPADHASVDAVIAAVLAGEVRTYEHRVLHGRTGALLHVRGIAQRITDAQGRPARIVGAIQDITDQQRMIAALADSEARFHGLFEALPLSLALWRRDGDDFVLEDVNRASVALTRGKARGQIGARLSAFYADLPWMIDLVTRCHGTGMVEATERAYPMRATGEVKHLGLKVAPTPPDHVLVIAEDIEERKQAEHRLRDTAALLLQAEELAEVGSWEWDCRAERGRVSANWCRLHGFDTPPTTAEAYLSIIHPDDRPATGAAFASARHGAPYAITHRIVHGETGSIRHMKVRGTPVPDDTGRITTIRGVTLDVSEQVQRERELAHNVMQLKLAQRIARIGNWTLDPATSTLTWSEETYRIYERDPAMGPPSLEAFMDLYPGPTRERVRTAVSDAVARGRPFEMTLRLDLPDRREKWVHALGEPEPTPGPAGHAVHGTVQDITDQKRAEAFRDDVERIIRHDLRSPIAATLAGISLLRLDETLGANHRHTLDMMERTSQRQLAMLDTSTALHRMESGTYTVDPVPVHLAAALGEVQDELRYLADARRATVAVDSDGDPWATGETWLCRTLLSNLVRNALEALPETGQTVHIRLTGEGDHAVVRIANPGSVPRDIRERFFEKYATSGKAGGTGLGTYSARMMARAQGGEVELDTSVQGHTTLTVRLPRATP